MNTDNFEPIKPKGRKTFKGQDCTKRRFKDHKQSIKVLHLSANRRVVDLAEFGETKRNEIRDYFCDRCRGFHVTSKETWGNPRKAA